MNGQEVIIPDANEATLTAILSQDADAATNAQTWRWVALGATGLALAALGLVYLMWLLRPSVVPLVQFVYVDAEQKVQLAGAPIPMEAYTPADWQWIDFLHEWVIRLRWRGIDEVQAQHAWKWLELHACGGGVEQHNRYFAQEQPLKHVGTKKRTIDTIKITKTDMPGIYTVTWKEVFIDGPKVPVVSTQTVHVAVARRTVTPEMHGINSYGLCVKSFGGLSI